MAIKGLTTPVIGDYSATGNTVTYSNAIVANKAVEYSATFEAGDDNPFYADDGIAENDKGTFISGELTLATADLPQELSMRILGTKSYSETVPASTSGGDDSLQVTTQVFDDNAKSPYLGVGIIETHQINDANTYRAVFFNKVYFKGESIEWQNPSLTGVIQRSDQVDANVNHPWMQDAWVDTQSDAIRWLIWKCGGQSEQTEANAEDGGQG